MGRSDPQLCASLPWITRAAADAIGSALSHGLSAPRIYCRSSQHQHRESSRPRYRRLREVEDCARRGWRTVRSAGAGRWEVAKVLAVTEDAQCSIGAGRPTLMKRFTSMAPVAPAAGTNTRYGRW